jgi:hypothetical protein
LMTCRKERDVGELAEGASGSARTSVKRSVGSATKATVEGKLATAETGSVLPRATTDGPKASLRSTGSVSGTAPEGKTPSSRPGDALNASSAEGLRRGISERGTE